MKDVYFFYSDEVSLKVIYGVMDQVYRNIFSCCGLDFWLVDVDFGAIGGFGFQEFMVLVDVGEDEIFYIEDGLYFVNVEKVVFFVFDVKFFFFSGYKKQLVFNIVTIVKMC